MMIFDILQIGAHVGDTFYDPIFKRLSQHSLSALLVEPLPFLMDQLRKNYAGSPADIVFEQSAIADYNGFIDIYHADPARFNYGHDEVVSALGSTSKKQLLKDRMHMRNQEVHTSRVPCMTLTGLISKHSITQVSEVYIDVEGLDIQVMRQLPVEQLRPSLVQFEHKHAEKTDIREQVLRMTAMGYAVEHTREDTIFTKGAG
jgi:FkbM family methyltransferase